MFRLDAVWDILGPGIKLDVFFYVIMKRSSHSQISLPQFCYVMKKM